MTVKDDGPKIWGVDFSTIEKRVQAMFDPAPMGDIAESIRTARVVSRELYTQAAITLDQYNTQKKLFDDLVLKHISWYRKVNPKFNELEFVGASGDGSAIF